MTALFSPIKLADLDLDNRIVVSPMCQYSADDGSANDWHLGHLGMLANSGAALVVVEATHVERRGRITHGCLGLYSDDNEAALARVLAHCRRVGTAKLGIQLAHAGRKASSYRPWEGGLGLKADDDPWATIAPSAIAFGNEWSAPRAMSRDDMERVRDAFVASAQRAVRLGFDAIELHMAHGYLLHSFMSPVSNHRSDEYGGSAAARLRFPLEVVRTVRAVVPRSLPLGARITGSDWTEGGLTPDDAVALAKRLKEAGLDFVCVSSGGITAEVMRGGAGLDGRFHTVKIPLGPGYQVPFAEKVRREAGIATRAVGLIATAQQAEAILAEGKADMIALARAMLDDPRWGWHAAQSLAAEVKRPPQYARAAPKLWPGAAYRA